mgnify:CR=1 FL=1
MVHFLYLLLTYYYRGKIIEIGSSPEYGFGGNDIDGPNEIQSQPSLRSRTSMNLNSSSKEQAPPTDTSVFINQVQLDPDFGTFEDENGDPCSAVWRLDLVVCENYVKWYK